MTKRFAVIGNPIAHSRSPELHYAFAQKAGIELQYDKILAPEGLFEASTKKFFLDGGCGLNITVPFKEKAYALCHVRTDRARIAKAVNTMWYKDGLLYGDNTDGPGLVDAILTLGWQLQQARILIIGAGGATRGVLYPLFQAGVKEMVIANRTLSRAEQLIADIQPFMPRFHLTAIGLDQLQGQFDIVINATSSSLSGQPIYLPETLQFSAAYEMAYGKDSAFLEQAQTRKVPAADGWSMLVGQAIESFKIWNGECEQLQLKDFL